MQHNREKPPLQHGHPPGFDAQNPVSVKREAATIAECLANIEETPYRGEQGQAFGTRLDPELREERL